MRASAEPTDVSTTNGQNLAIETIKVEQRRPHCKVWPLMAMSCCCNLLLVVVVVILFATGFEHVLADRSRQACSNHGMWFDDIGTCSCFDCWTGDTCEEQLKGDECIVTAASGTPWLFEDYWLAHPQPRLSLLPSYHLGYGSDVPRLEAAIRKLHDLIGNYDARNQHLVIGVGSTELISAALYALSPQLVNGTSTGAKAAVWAKAPYYSGYVDPSKYFRSEAFGWAPPSDTPPVATEAAPVIELVTSPNNPDGRLRNASVSGPHTSVLYDFAYLWPHFAPIPSPPPLAYNGSDRATDPPTVALFTLSKMTGHASTRIGWALTPSKEVADRLRAFTAVVTLGTPRENQLRAARLLEHVVARKGDIFAFAREHMLTRWQCLEAIFASSAAEAPEQSAALANGTARANASLVPLLRLAPRDAPAFDAFSGEVNYESSPAYAWLELTDTLAFGGDAMAAVRSVGIVGRSGVAFGASKAWVRLELLMRQETFELLCSKLRTLVGRHAAGGV